MKRTFAAALLALAVAIPSVAMEPIAHAEQKIVYVDLQRAMGETDEGKKAIARIKSEFEKKQKDLDVRQDELKRMKENLDKQATVLKPEAQAKSQGEFQQKFVQLQETYVRLQKELEEKQQREMQRLLAKMQGIIGEIAQREGYTFVLEKNAGIVYGPPSLDITNEVIRKYNAAPAAK